METFTANDAKQNLGTVIDRALQKPVSITRHGRTAAVMLSPDAYDALSEKAELIDNLAMIDSSLEDIQAGRTQDARSAIQSLAEKHNIEIKR